MTMLKKIGGGFSEANVKYQPNWLENFRALRAFSRMLTEIFLYPVVVVCNTLRLRCPLFEKKRCFVKIFKKEIKTSDISVHSGEEPMSSSLKKHIIFFSFGYRKEYVEVDKETYNQLQIGDQLQIEYIDGKDRLHARVPKKL